MVIIMILMKDIIQEGHPTLRKRSVEVPLPLSNEDLTSLREMMEYVVSSQNPELVESLGLRPAVGLSAPQINISKRMFVMLAENETFTNYVQWAIVNPKIISYSEEMTYIPGGEGCLSVDEEKNGLVPRYARFKAKVHLVNLETGETKETLLKLSGFIGVVFQHEYDHLQGVLFVDKLNQDLSQVKPIEFIEPTEE